jgi:hypothetical protein
MAVKPCPRDPSGVGLGQPIYHHKTYVVASMLVVFSWISKSHHEVHALAP